MKRRNLRSLQRRKERKRLRGIILPLLLSVVAVCGTALLVRHAVAVKDIVFIGNRQLKGEELRSLIRLRSGDALFSLSGRDLHGLLKKSPWIKDAAVRKELSGRVIIKVSERVPAAILSLAGTPYLIDKDGAPLEPIREGNPLLLPVIKEIDPAANRETYREAVRLMGVLRARDIAAYEGSLEITGARPEDLTLAIDGVVIKVGMGDFERKLERLAFVKDEIGKRNLQVDSIDLRFANKIVVTPASPAQAAASPAGPAGPETPETPETPKQKPAKKNVREQEHGKKKKR